MLRCDMCSRFASNIVAEKRVVGQYELYDRSRFMCYECTDKLKRMLGDNVSTVDIGTFLDELKPIGRNNGYREYYQRPKWPAEVIRKMWMEKLNERLENEPRL